MSVTSPDPYCSPQEPPGPYPPAQLPPGQPISGAPYSPPPPVRPTSGLATASLVLGILGLVAGCCSFGVPSIIAVFLGHAALRETKTGTRGGHGAAIAGLILGYVVAIPAFIISITWFVGIITSGSTTGTTP